jgi:hypothetical protein
MRAALAAVVLASGSGVASAQAQQAQAPQAASTQATVARGRMPCSGVSRQLPGRLAAVGCLP